MIYSICTLNHIYLKKTRIILYWMFRVRFTNPYVVHGISVALKYIVIPSKQIQYLHSDGYTRHTVCNVPIWNKGLAIYFLQRTYSKHLKGFASTLNGIKTELLRFCIWWDDPNSVLFWWTQDIIIRSIFFMREYLTILRKIPNRCSLTWQINNISESMFILVSTRSQKMSGSEYDRRTSLWK